MSGYNFSVINVCKKRHLLPALFITQQLLWLPCVSVSSTHIFSRALTWTSPMEICMYWLHLYAWDYLSTRLLHLLNRLVPQPGKEMHHRQWQDSGACWLLCIFNPKISALLLWIHPLQLRQVTVCHSRSCDSAAHLVLPLNPFIVSHPSAPFSFSFLSSSYFSNSGFSSRQSRRGCSSQASNRYVVAGSLWNMHGDNCVLRSEFNNRR